MFNTIFIKENQDYFLPLNKRNSSGVYFYRFIGFDSATLSFLQKYLKETKSNGYYFESTIANPSENDVKFYNFRANPNFSFSLPYIKDTTKRILDFLPSNKIDLLSEAIFNVLTTLNNKGANINIIKNASIKFTCWLSTYRSILKNIGENTPPKILYEGNITKYEVYFLTILAKAGCDIVYINFEGEDSFAKYDDSFSKVIYGEKKEKLPTHFSNVDLNLIKEENNLINELNDNSNNTILNSWLSEDFLENIFKPNNIRAISTAKLSKIHTMFIECVGIDDESLYNNRLYSLKRNLDKSNKPYILFDNLIENPSMNEVSEIERFNFSNREELIKGLLLVINNIIDDFFKPFFLRAFSEALNKEKDLNLPKLYNLGIKLICWGKRITSSLTYKNEVIPLVIYYGECKPNELIFIDMLSSLPIDILYFCPKKDTKMLSKAEPIILDNTMDIKAFPKTEFKVKVATTAYSAERELDSILYNDTGLYREQQYSKATSVTLKTTYEEISILWDKEAKYRPSFKTDEGKVYIPNIFAKINGIKNGDLNKYIKDIKKLLIKDTLVFQKFPFISRQSMLSWESIQKFSNGNTLSFEKLRNSREYKYSYLNEDTQRLIFDKIQELINLNWLKNTTDFNIYYVLLNTLLNLDKETLMLLQQFDFTKSIPKIIVINTDENMPDITDCIYLLFLNLVGFDILVFTPTGYRNIEKYIKEDVFENHIIGEYMFNVNMPHLYTNSREKNSSGFFSRLFGN
ncbi:MAG: hypothetical protein E7214_09780 [Clostridium sp.]|nr:hypothetical protein [Clostridium sp.]